MQQRIPLGALAALLGGELSAPERADQEARALLQELEGTLAQIRAVTQSGDDGSLLAYARLHAEAVSMAERQYAAQADYVLRKQDWLRARLAEQGGPDFQADLLAAALQAGGLRIVSGGTDNHLMLVDCRPLSITGKAAEDALGKAGITVNKNQIPFDPEKPNVSSGVRVGTPAVTSRGMKEPEMRQVAGLIVDALKSAKDEGGLGKIKERVKALATAFPLYRSRLEA